VDWLRAASLLVVVLWHWAFSILSWSPTSISATNPLSYTSGLWIFTWLLQVLPLFFYVGGHVHLGSWERASARGEHIVEFAWRRIRTLATPAAALAGIWLAGGAVFGWFFQIPWIPSLVLLVLSPLWFLGVYVGLIALLPITLWLHRRFDILVLVWLAGIAMLVDVLRLRYGVTWLGWLNMVVVWGLAHQAGFFYRRISAAPRRLDFALLWAGLFALAGLVFSGLYPGSMVGVPGDRMSNMAPPTFVIVALLTFQVGVAGVLRPSMERVLLRPRWSRLNAVINEYALPLFLLHTTGFAVARFVGYYVLPGGIVDDGPLDLLWWLERPIAVLAALAFTIPLVLLFARTRTPTPQHTT
jgi:hypothetical protein